MQTENIVSCPIELFRSVNLDYTRLTIETLDCTNFELHDFPISPKEYLKFARQDLKDKDDRGLINALSNAKRCIDCLIESTLIGLHFNIGKELSTDIIDFCNNILSDEDKEIQPNQLKLFTALGLAPSILISEVRLLRNKIEHDYELPKRNEVIKAIEVAELLINNVTLKRFDSYTILISDTKNNNNGIMIDTDYNKNNIISFELVSGNIPSKDRFHRESKYILNGNESIYCYLLRTMIIAEQDEENLLDTIKLLINKVSPEQPNQYIKIKEIK